MTSILEIVKNYKYIFLNIEINPKTGKKSPKGLFFEWKEENNTEILNNKNLQRIYNDKYNQVWFRCEKEYIIFDADNENSYNIITKYLIDNKLYEPLAITKSYHRELHYKNHFWFKVDNKNLFNDLQEGQIEFNGGEIFFGFNCILGEYKTSILDNIPILTREKYNEIYNLLKKTEKIIKQTKNIKIDKIKENVNIMEYSETELLCKKILDGLKPHRYNKYCYWLISYFIIINEKINIEIFNNFSSKCLKYNKEENDKILKNIKFQKGYTISTLYYWLKEDNIELFNELCKTRKDFWNMSLDNHSMAILYYNLIPNNYIYNYNLGWFEYSSNNILLNRGKNTPLSLFNSFSNILKEYAIEQRNLLDKNDVNYTEKMKKFTKFFDTVGRGNFIDNTLKQLAGFYLDDELEQKLNNKNYLAFNNILYDNTINKFRNIDKDDYITLTTGYNLNSQFMDKNLKKQIKSIIHSIFENKEIEKYWLYITALTLFGNQKERFYIHSGKGGGNGKGLTQRLLLNTLGQYYKQVSNNFLMGSVKKGQADPELSSCVGIRYLSVSEPDDTENKKFNISNLKSYSGNDPLSTRNLFGSSFQFLPQFTINIACNEIPKMSTIDGGIKRRISIFNYPFEFRDKDKIINPSIQKPINYELKDKIINNHEFIQTFILLLIKYSFKYKDIDLKTPQEILNYNENYCNENNELNDWFNETIIKTNNDKDKIKSSVLLISYNSSNYCIKKLRPVEFSKLMEKLNINKKDINNAKFYTNIKFNIEENETDDF